MQVRYVLVDVKDKALFLGIHEGVCYFSTDKDFIEENLVHKAVTFESAIEAAQFGMYISITRNPTAQLKPIAVKVNQGKHIDLYDLCRQGYAEFTKSMLASIEPFNNTIH